MALDFLTQMKTHTTKTLEIVLITPKILVVEGIFTQELYVPLQTQIEQQRERGWQCY
jgi:hypothetical protein